MGLLSPQITTPDETESEDGQAEAAAKSADRTDSAAVSGTAKGDRKLADAKQQPGAAIAGAPAQAYWFPVEIQQGLEDASGPVVAGDAGNKNGAASVANAAGQSGNTAAAGAAGNNAETAADPLAFTMLVSAEGQNAPVENPAASAAVPAPLADLAHPGSGLATAALATAAENVAGGQKAQAPSNGLAAASNQGEAARAPDEQSAPVEKASAGAGANLDANAEGGRNELVRNVHVQLETESNQRVDVRMTDQGGGLRVSVRAADSNLAQALQDHMPELTNRLEQQHFQAEVWIPRTAASSDAGAANARSFNSQGGDGGSQGHSGRRQNGNQDNRPDWFDQDGRLQPGNKERTQQVWLQ